MSMALRYIPSASLYSPCEDPVALTSSADERVMKHGFKASIGAAPAFLSHHVRKNLRPIGEHKR